MIFSRAMICCLGFSLLSVSLPLSADDQKLATTVARWQHKGPDSSISIDVSDLLTIAQREIINSGFSTFTMLALSPSPIRTGEDLPDMRLICSVKYDTWEERYQIIRVDPAPVETRLIKEYKEWASQCLHFKITDHQMLKNLKNGGRLYGILQIRQSSPEESAKIKNWLIRQQSGFMQGLYAHMLGDFQFKGSVKLDVKILPETFNEKEEADEKTSASPRDRN